MKSFIKKIGIGLLFLLIPAIVWAWGIAFISVPDPSGGGGSVTIEDVFSTYVYTGTGATPTITTNIDLSTNDGVTWIKNRDQADGHRIFDTLRAATFYLESQATTASTEDADTLTAFSSTGFTLGADVTVNTNTEDYTSWTFRQADNFFGVQEATLGTGDETVSFPDLATLGIVIVKRKDSTGSFYVWHKDLTAGKLLYLEQTAAEATLGHITVSGTTVTLVDGTLADGDYVVYAWAHDTDADTGMIQCGSYAGNSSENHISLGWEPQLVLIKPYTGASSAQNWNMFDTMRGGENSLRPNLSDAENVMGDDRIYLEADGFYFDDNDAEVNSVANSYIYMAIRRPMKTPGSASEVFAIDTRGSTADGQRPAYRSDFPIDMAILSHTTGATHNITSRLTQSNTLYTDTTGAEAVNTAMLYDYQNGYFDSGTTVATNISHMFKRAPGFMDVVAYTGTGVAHTEAHNLGVTPGMIWAKDRDAAFAWTVYITPLGATKYIWLNETNAALTHSPSSEIWNDTDPTDSVFSLGDGNSINRNGDDYIAYLFATLAGISKVGSFSHTNGTPTNVDCGFSAGSKMVIAKRTDDTGDWYLWDSERGIIAGDDPYLLLNTTAAEVTNTDYIDPYADGFTVSSDFITGDYIYYAVAEGSMIFLLPFFGSLNRKRKEMYADDYHERKAA